VDVIEAIKKSGACRYFKPDAVPSDVLERLFDAARHGPQGGNRQPVRYIAVRDPELKRQLGVWYLEVWNSVMGMAARGEYRTARGSSASSPILSAATYLAEHLAEVPVLVVVCAVFDDLARTDAALDRPGVVGGASIYPSVQNLLLAARNEGLGAVMTTLLCSVEPQVKQLLDIPEGVITCATVPIGYPARPLPQKLSRVPVEQIAYADRFGAPLFPG
jgi:nitroreductase